MSNPVVPAAPPERAPVEELRAQASLIEAMPGFQKVIDALPVMTAVLNAQRQIVAANSRFVQFTGAESATELCGCRLGEALGCVNSNVTETGCGTSEACSVCGALKAMVSSQLGQARTHLCRMRRRAAIQEECLEVEVWATPLDVSGHYFTLVSLSNASDRERRKWLERGVVPRTLALAAEIEALVAGLNRSEAASKRDRTLALLGDAARRLASTVQDEIDLSTAEAGGLAAAPRHIAASDVLHSAAAEFEFDEAARGRALAIERETGHSILDTDPVLLQRVLTRLLINALEATPAGEKVTFGVRSAGDYAELWVRNPGAMPRSVQLQMFQRSFSTKGPGRGFGTYFARLISERCLRGTVFFRSSPEEGTEFVVRVPRVLDTEVQA